MTPLRAPTAILSATLAIAWFLGSTGTPSGRLETTISESVRRAAEREERVWVFLSNKGPDALGRSAAVEIPERMAARIRLRGSQFDARIELPIHSGYRDQLADAGMVIKNELRWLNAVTGWVHPDDLESIAALPFVDSLKPVVTFRRSPLPDVEALDPLPKMAKLPADVFDYGNSRAQLALIGVNHLHAAGLSGRGVRVGFLDTGFSLDIRAFDCLDIRGTRDFINGDIDVGDGELGQMLHGTQTLSLCAGFDEGDMVGPAPGAEYVVAKTEIVNREIEAEEDNWVAGLEWLDSMGCDIVSSSLGYVEWYTDEDFDGNTAPSTIAADLAAARGVLVVNAAGNDSCGNGDIRIIVPADGDSVLTVGASTFSGEWAVFSSCGPTADGRTKPDVIAPGQGVLTAYPISGSYHSGNGTSFSTPLVSGVCALLLEHDSTLTPFDLITLLRSTADRAFKPRVTYGWGLVQAVAAAGIDTNSLVPARPFICPIETLDVASIYIAPNPANTAATIFLPEGGEGAGVYRIFSLAGRLVYQGDIAARIATWNGTNVAGERVAAGVYLVRVKTPSQELTLKLAWLPSD